LTDSHRYPVTTADRRFRHSIQYRIPRPQGRYEELKSEDRTGSIDDHSNLNLDLALDGAVSGSGGAAPRDWHNDSMEGPPSPDDKHFKREGRGKDKIPRATRSGGRKTVDTAPAIGNQKLASLPPEKQDDSINEVQKAKKSEKTKKPPPPLKPSGLYFSSAVEARQSTQGLKWGPREDETLPKTQKEREAIVARLLAAIQDMGDFQDKEGPMFKNRWVGPPLEEPDGMSGERGEAAPREATDKHYHRWDKEAVCWDILVSTDVRRTYMESNSLTGHG
jgi:hypothetical protein